MAIGINLDDDDDDDIGPFSHWNEDFEEDNMRSRPYSEDDAFDDDEDLIREASEANPTNTKTSAQWQMQFPEKVVVDPDGWDRTNFTHSWYREQITLEEYQRRVSLSTVMSKHDV